MVLEGRADHPEILQELKETAEPWRDEPEGSPEVLGQGSAGSAIVVVGMFSTGPVPD